jgi:hypothetical protein
MKHGIWTLAVLAASVMGPGQGRAEFVQVAFTGHVVQIDNPPLHAAAIKEGDQLTGSFSYDTAASPDPSGAQYTASAFQSPGQLSLRVGGLDFRTNSTSPLNLQVGSYLASPLSVFFLTGQVSDAGLCTPPLPPGELRIEFAQPNGDLFGSVPPEASKLKQAEHASLVLNFQGPGSRCRSFTLAGEFDTLGGGATGGSNSPEPTALLLGITGAAGLIPIVWKNRRRGLASRGR